MPSQSVFKITTFTDCNYSMVVRLFARGADEVSGSWFFVVASEAISVRDTKIALPGIGAWLSAATARPGDQHDYAQEGQCSEPDGRGHVGPAQRQGNRT